MTTYASNTDVSVSRSIDEIRKTIIRFGATNFEIIQSNKYMGVGFEMKERRVRFKIDLPRVEDYARTPAKNIRRSAVEQNKAWDQAVRQRHRALLLVIKAKLEAVDSGIETFDEAFMSHLILPAGQTMGEWYKPQIEDIFSGEMPPLLLSWTSRGEGT